MTIKAYTYEADVHCVECTLKRHKLGMFDLRPSDWSDSAEGNDENGLPYAAEDKEGNLVHPVFSTDEFDYEPCCGDCLCDI